jgi:predicted transport protein
VSDVKLFRIAKGEAIELYGAASDLEKRLQTLIENNLDVLLGVRFLATEYSTGKTHAGRIDSLGLDEDDCPVIIEYKRSTGENVINQGLFYLDWLMDHQAEFHLLVMNKLGKKVAENIDWNAPRLICLAADFTRYDGHAVQQIKRNIELIRYRQFGDELLLLELVNAVSAPASRAQNQKKAKPTQVSRSESKDKSYTEWLKVLPRDMLDLLRSVENHIGSLGDDIQRKELRLYVAFKRLKNFVAIVPYKKRLLLYLNLDPSKLSNLPANARDVTNIGHWATGHLEVSIANTMDFDAAKSLIRMAYEGHAPSSTLKK